MLLIIDIDHILLLNLASQDLVTHVHGSEMFTHRNNKRYEENRHVGFLEFKLPIRDAYTIRYMLPTNTCVAIPLKNPKKNSRDRNTCAQDDLRIRSTGH